MPHGLSANLSVCVPLLPFGVDDVKLKVVAALVNDRTHCNVQH